MFRPLDNDTDPDADPLSITSVTDVPASDANIFPEYILPILNPLEMNATPELVAERVRTHEDLRQQFEQLTGESPDAAPNEAVLVVIAKALAAYQETLVTPRTKAIPKVGTEVVLRLRAPAEEESAEEEKEPQNPPADAPGAPKAEG